MTLQKTIIIFLLAVGLFAVACGDGYEYKPGEKTIPPPLIDLLDGEFPIVAWTGINANEAADKFPSMKEVGCNIYLGWYQSLDEVVLVLQSAEKAGVKVILSCPDLDSRTEATVKQMKNFSSLYGYYIDDEPEVSDYKVLSSKLKKIQSFDIEHSCYINLYPNWAWGGAAGYAAKVKGFLNQVPVSFLSFDYYPIVETNGISSLRPDWYKNLEDIASAAKNKNIPFWAFALALSHGISNELYPIPTIAELRLQMFSNLVYGAQGFQYFTYWGIYQNGPTNVYERVKTVNRELQNLSSVFLGANVISVWHTGAQLPNGTHPIDKLPAPIKALTTSDGGAVVSFLQKADNQYLAVVNRDYKNQMQLTVSLDAVVKQVRKDGTVVAATSGTQVVDAGDIMIFTWKK
ncbi:MAG: hypothetical protein ABFC90_03665 [Bacteroidales bacterium]|nr:hypothetical protein [Bacteroidales bacterium]